jgi:hypothetical protein
MASSIALKVKVRRCFLLHGLMVSGAMYDPLIELLRDRFRMLIPDAEPSASIDSPALEPTIVSQSGCRRLAQRRR